MQVLLILQILIVIGLVATILVQKSSSDGFTGASSPSAFMSGRAQANLFTRVTSIFAALFIVNSLVLAYMASHTERGVTILDKFKSKKTEQTQEKQDSEITKAKTKLKSVKTDENSGVSETTTENELKTEDNSETSEPLEAPLEKEVPADKKDAAPSVPISE